ncbi:MAG: peptidase C39 family protein [Rhizobiaceae bacterium]|nr:peptidase C39 family protein [Rhizobiaceae bacterium]
MPAVIRTADVSDLDSLVAIEKRAFAGDRISRRSFRKFLDRQTAETLIAHEDGAAVGYCMVLFRRGSGVARLYSIAVVAGGGGVGRALLSQAEDMAYDRGRMLMRLEVREDNERAIRLYEKNGYRRFGREPDYYHDGEAALRYEKLLRGEVPVRTAVPYVEQSVEFTCGPCCLMMAMAHFLPDFTPSETMEIRLWRHATTVFMLSGPGGCEPFGLAVTAADRGLSAEIVVSHVGALFLQSVRSAEKRRVMEITQADFRDQAERHGIPVDYRAFTVDDIRGAVAGGRLVIVLISEFLNFGKKTPHWVLVVGDEAGHFVVHDPWVETEHGESRVDAAAIPIPHQVFYRMARFGGMRAAVILGRRT